MRRDRGPNINGVQSFNDVQWWCFTVDGRLENAGGQGENPGNW